MTDAAEAAVVLGLHADLDPPRDDEAQRCEGRIVVLDQTGDIWELRCEGCGFEAGMPARLADSRLQRRLLERHAGFPQRFTARFEKTAENASAIAATSAWLDAYDPALPRDGRSESNLPAPAIWGLPGRGKSHLLVTICRALIRDQGVSVMFRSVARLLDELQDGFDTAGEYGRIWEQAVTVDVLALDDVGAQQLTEWRTDRLARLVDERWERMLPVLVATNYPPGRWEGTMDERTRSRLRGMTFGVELRGVDRRQLTVDGE